MSSVILNIPDDGWFMAGNNTKPEYYQLCIVIHKYGNRTPAIMQYRKSDWLYSNRDYFLDVSEKWRLDAYGCGNDWEPGFAPMTIIEKWKPLGLPDGDNRRLVEEIEKWFDD